MLALAVTLLVVVALLSVLVAGLLRSHADILRALHELGAGVGDPVAAPGRAGPPLPVVPAERSPAVHDLEGVGPGGDAVVVAATAAPLTLLAFLSADCSSCAGVWEGLGDPAQRGRFPAGTRFVAVTKGPEWETPAAVTARAPRGVTVVMSTQAWADYEIPGSPYVVLVDGSRRLGEGVGRSLGELADLAARSAADAGAGPSRGRAATLGLDGPEREAHNDAVLRSAGILPGDPSLYPPTRADPWPRSATGG